jgi:hypothetical protein
MRWIPIILSLIVFSSCSRYITIERSERFANKEELKKKIICIDPQVRLVGFAQNDADEATELENWLIEELEYASRQNEIEFEVVRLTKESKFDYYEDLLRLKKELVQANNSQNTPLNFNSNHGYNAITKSVFVYPPLIAHDFVDLSKKFGTPYYSSISIIKQPGRILLYHLMVNTDTAETVYRELKAVGKSKLKKKHISQFVYDSLTMLKADLK